MRRILLGAVFALACLMGSVGHAETHKFPEDKPTLSIDLPDDWTVEPDPDGDVGLYAQSPDELIELNLYLREYDVTSRKENEGVGQEVNEIIAEYVKNFKAVNRLDGKDLNGLMMSGVFGTGTYKESGEDAMIAVLHLVPNTKQAFVLVYWGSQEAEKKHHDTMSKIVDSLKKL